MGLAELDLSDAHCISLKCFLEVCRSAKCVKVIVKGLARNTV